MRVWVKRTRGRRPVRAAALALLCVTAPSAVVAQVHPAPPPGSPPVVVAPGAEYAHDGVYSALLGGGWRTLWTTPIEVPVVDLGTLGGGLTPRGLGGGMTTTTLHLDGADGRRYVFRSVNKRPADLLEDFEGSPLESILQDQISSFHPTGAPVVASLLETVRVLHPVPTLMVVPDDPRLGEFRERFAGMLVLVEERPDDGPDGRPGFGGSRDIEQTDDLLDALESGPDHRVDAEALLRARLVDLLVGDRDRSHNNHLWARFDERGGRNVWRVIPRDRDQSFVRFDGVLKSLARRYERRLVSFDDAYPDLQGLTRNAWDLDRNLLVGLDRATWDRIVADVSAALTDAAIERAVSMMPTAHVALVGDELTAALRARRDHLAEAADALYDIVFRYADVHGTDVAERVTVDVAQDGSLAVRIVPEAWGDETSYARTFRTGETRELRLYLHGGDDRVVVRGAGPTTTRVRLVGGGGMDALLDSVPGRGASIDVYDDDDDTRIAGPGRARWHRRDAPRPYSWFELERDLDWGSVTVPAPGLEYDEDRGLVVTAGARHERYGFAKRPFHDRIGVEAGWGFGASAPVFDYRHLLLDAVAGADLRLRLRWSGLDILNYYGMGNGTQAISEPHHYHRVTHKRVSATASLGVGRGPGAYVALGPTFVYTSTDTTEATSKIADEDPYGAGQFAQAGLQLTFRSDSRDAPGTPASGTLLQGGASWFPAVLDAERGAFGEAHAQAAAYLSPEGRNPVLALRVAGKSSWGSYPFHEAAFLGGPESLRSLRVQRYAGDATLLGSAELRVEVGRVTFPVPSDVGVLAFTEAGRVFLEGDDADDWHSAVGGGLWFALINRSNLVQLSVAHGGGATRLVAGMGFAY